MIFDLFSLNWLVIITCVVVGQIFLTLWFAVIFADPWAKAYGVADKAEHTAQVPAYTYAIGAACVLLLTIGLAVLQQSLSTSTLAGGLTLGLCVALFFSLTTALPGYAFLKRWSAFWLAMSAQVTLILILSLILAIWR